MFHRQEEFGGEGKCFRLYSTGSAARASLWNLPRFLEGLGHLLQRRAACELWVALYCLCAFPCEPFEA